MSLKVTKRSIRDVTILDCAGRPTLGEGSSTLRNVIRELIESGRKKIILNLSDVSYIDSSGIGELLSGFTTVHNHGGRLMLMHLAKRVADLLQITKFYTVFEVYDEESKAIRDMEVQPLHALCPICGSVSSPASPDGASWPPQRCGNANCGAEFTIGRAEPNSCLDPIESVRISTYPDEYFEVLASHPFRIAVVGRLNLFSSSGLKKLWRALPSRIAIVDLRQTTEISEEGRDVLLELIASAGKAQRVTISLQGLASRYAAMFADSQAAFPDDASAVAALGDLITDTPRWTARFR